MSRFDQPSAILQAAQRLSDTLREQVTTLSGEERPDHPPLLEAAFHTLLPPFTLHTPPRLGRPRYFSSSPVATDTSKEETPRAGAREEHRPPLPITLDHNDIKIIFERIPSPIAFRKVILGDDLPRRAPVSPGWLEYSDREPASTTDYYRRFERGQEVYKEYAEGSDVKKHIVRNLRDGLICHTTAVGFPSFDTTKQKGWLLGAIRKAHFAAVSIAPPGDSDTLACKCSIAIMRIKSYLG